MVASTESRPHAESRCDGGCFENIIYGITFSLTPKDSILRFAKEFEESAHALNRECRKLNAKAIKNRNHQRFSYGFLMLRT
ncbi:transposase, IS605 OrfB family protein [Anopheles sinensis]|uniref:Transposase, IS605 OrfB family protein n=1 Tax=Anopheles sinensis TaxID=74873 RepID=A0A084VMG3_ANOSI|nr:transposase, IS605 OrfB family protein [Anopheles sinensis]